MLLFVLGTWKVDGCVPCISKRSTRASSFNFSVGSGRNGDGSEPRAHVKSWWACLSVRMPGCIVSSTGCWIAVVCAITALDKREGKESREGGKSGGQRKKRARKHTHQSWTWLFWDSSFSWNVLRNTARLQLIIRISFTSSNRLSVVVDFFFSLIHDDSIHW